MRNIRNYGNGYTDRIFVCHLSEQTDWLQEATNKQTDKNSRSSASPSLTLYVFTLSPPSLSERGDPQQSLLTSAQKEFVLVHLQDNTFQLIISVGFVLRSSFTLAFIYLHLTKKWEELKIQANNGWFICCESPARAEEEVNSTLFAVQLAIIRGSFLTICHWAWKF